jgi:hypothetical protein
MRRRDAPSNMHWQTVAEGIRPSSYCPQKAFSQAMSFQSAAVAAQAKKKSRSWPWIVLGCGVLLVLFIGTCARTLAQAGQESDYSVSTFHSRLNAHSCDIIYTDASAEFQQISSKSEWSKVCSGMSRKMGTHKTSERQRITLKATTSGKLLTVLYSSEFALGRGEEEFTWKYDGDRLLLYGYNLKSNNLFK